VSYGDLPLDAPEKPNKGIEGGACNRRACQAEPALWYNHGSYAWYCGDCARDIGQDPINLRDWNLRWRPSCGHDMFETREMMSLREAAKNEVHDDVCATRRGHPCNCPMAAVGQPKHDREPEPTQPDEYSISRLRGQKVHSPSLERMLRRTRSPR
jgi:hypothetical protein